MAQEGTRCRIYAPVGAHRDLLAYLVRRLLENGANSSFVNQIVDEDVPPEEVARDPFEAIADDTPSCPPGPTCSCRSGEIPAGFDLTHQPTLDAIEAARGPFATTVGGRAPSGGRAQPPRPEAPHEATPPIPPTAPAPWPSPARRISKRRSSAAARGTPAAERARSSTAPPTSTRRISASSSR